MKTIQICVAGSINSGKSSLLRRYKQNKFNQNHCVPTLGYHSIYVEVDIQGTKYKLELIDTQGFDMNRGLLFIPQLKNYKGFIIVYDIASADSFKNAKVCFDQIKQHCQPQNQNMYVIGNKTDLKQKRMVQTSQAMQYWNEIDVQFSQTSAKKDNGIVKLINRVAKTLARDHIFKKGSQNDNSFIKLNQGSQKKSSGGCC